MSRLSRKISSIWQGFQSVFSVEEGIKTSTETGKAVLEAAKTLKEQSPSIDILKPVVQNSSSLLDVLCSPVAQVIGASLPFVPLAIALLKFSRDISRQEPTLEECVAIISQAAYLESWKEIISAPENQGFLDILNNNSPNIDTSSLLESLEKINRIELDIKTVQTTIVRFAESELAQVYNQVLFVSLQQGGIGASAAKIITERVARNCDFHFYKALAQAGDNVKLLADLYRNGGLEVIQQADSIEQYLNEQIKVKPDEFVFTENFTFRDIYVALQAYRVDVNGQVKPSQDNFDLEKWAKTNLLDQTKNKQVLFIQGSPGRGKSVFCRMFADWVRLYLHPYWTPILIRLRDIEEFQVSLEETLRSRIKYDFAQTDDGWLTDNRCRYVFILDGFDELRIERNSNQSIEKFIRQVGLFQEDYGSRHRVILTGRAMALHGIDRLPANLEKVEIAPMDAALRDEWFYKWYQLFPGDRTIELQNFLLNDSICPIQIQELAKEPLLLYMLAAMYRDGKLDLSKFFQVRSLQAISPQDNVAAKIPLNQAAGKIVIYEQAIDWVLTKQRSDSRNPNLNQELTQQNPQALRRLLAESAVAVVQSGTEYAAISMVKARLQQDEEARELLTQAENKLGKEEALKNTLAAFYLQSNDSGGVEFSHKSFREFLCAERIKQSLEDWTEKSNRIRRFNISDEQLYKEIYDLFGYNDGLTTEIVEYLFQLLQRDFSPSSTNEIFWIDLFERLYDFYLQWCDHKFIDLVTETLPQKKAAQLQVQSVNIGQLGVDIYTGLNVMILLLEIHRYAQTQPFLTSKINFHPCGQPDTDYFNQTQLLRIINYCDAIKVGTLNEVVGSFLNHINLSNAHLSGTCLAGVNLNHANLSDANLSGVNLGSTNLANAYLSGSNLCNAFLNYASLTKAYLSGTSLIDASLISVNLSSAYLEQANLTRVNLSDADISRAVLSNVCLNRANLSCSNLSDATLSDANLSDANLSDGNLSRVNLTGANLSRADLSRVDLTQANLCGVNLTNANLTNADLSDADLSNANLSGANLRGANLRGAKLYSTILGDRIWGNVRWDKNTNWQEVQGLEQSKNRPGEWNLN